MELVALQLSVLGSYRPPIPGIGVGVGDGVGVGIGGSLGVGIGVEGSPAYLASMPLTQLGHPPHTIISLVVQTAV